MNPMQLLSQENDVNDKVEQWLRETKNETNPVEDKSVDTVKTTSSNTSHRSISAWFDDTSSNEGL